MSFYKTARPLLRKIEAFVRQFRAYLVPSAYITYFKLSKLGLNLPNKNTPCAFFDFKGTQIDYVGGRYLYYLVQDVISAGYHPIYINNFRFLHTLPYKPFKKLLLQDSFGVRSKKAKLPENSIYFSDQNIKHKSASKNINVSFELKRPENSNELQLPFAFFPTLLKQEESILYLGQNNSRSKHIFFGGKADPRSHDKAGIKEKYGLITRTAAIQAIEQKIKENFLPAEALHLHYKPEDRIQTADWMPTMADSEFFIALPGVTMPLCHNLIEALAVGTIPILQYPDYLDPGLKDGYNCLVYNNSEDLIGVIKKALSLSEEIKTQLSKNAKDYYKEHLKLGQFTNRILNLRTTDLTIYINANRVPRNK